MYADQRGYPTLSLLPDHFSPSAVDVIRQGLHARESGRRPAGARSYLGAWPFPAAAVLSAATDARRSGAPMEGA